MGREALIQATAGDEAGEARALLEASELVLRGAVRRRFAKTAITDVAVEDGTLRFVHAGERVALRLGPAADAWAQAIRRPPPSLRTKLGLDGAARARLIGRCDDPALAEALDGRLADDEAAATVMIARIDAPGDLAAARLAHGATPDLPLWAIYPKGAGAGFGDAAIRAELRACGFRDTKSCAVSERLTATRYHPASPRGGSAQAASS